MMEEGIIEKLTFKDDKYACAFAYKIILESRETDKWYEYFNIQGQYASVDRKGYSRNR